MRVPGHWLCVDCPPARVAAPLRLELRVLAPRPATARNGVAVLHVVAPLAGAHAGLARPVGPEAAAVAALKPEQE